MGVCFALRQDCCSEVASCRAHAYRVSLYRLGSSRTSGEFSMNIPVSDPEKISFTEKMEVFTIIGH